MVNTAYTNQNKTKNKKKLLLAKKTEKKIKSKRIINIICIYKICENGFNFQTKIGPMWYVWKFGIRIGGRRLGSILGTGIRSGFKMRFVVWFWDGSWVWVSWIGIGFRNRSRGWGWGWVSGWRWGQGWGWGQVLESGQGLGFEKGVGGQGRFSEPRYGSGFITGFRVGVLGEIFETRPRPAHRPKNWLRLLS